MYLFAGTIAEEARVFSVALSLVNNALPSTSRKQEKKSSILQKSVIIFIRELLLAEDR